MGLIIAIDGYSSCGKSTLAKQLARQLNYLFIDTGAMYRAFTLYFLREEIPLTEVSMVKDALQRIKLRMVNYQNAGKSEIFLNNENVSNAIRDFAVSEKVSEVSALKEVRDFAVTQQRAIGQDGGVVMDGRDIGTVVFPNADLKVFMTAEINTRARRRFEELKATHPDISLTEIKSNLEKRDYIDTHRNESPLVKAKDARLLDNSNIGREEQLEIVLQWTKKILAERSKN